MTKTNRWFIWAVVLLTIGVGHVWAQPNGGARGERGGRGGGARGAMMAMRSVQIEQVLSFLAFNDKVALTDAQLVKVRNELKPIFIARADLVAKLSGSQDREAAMTEVRKLRSQMTQKLTGLLEADQLAALKTYMQEMTQRGGRGGQGGRGREGGGRRGGGGGGE